MLVLELLLILSGALAQVSGSGETREWRPIHIYKMLVRSGRFIFFLSQNNNVTISEDIDISAGNAILAFTIQIANLSLQLQVCFIISIFATSSLTIWIATTNFVKDAFLPHVVVSRNFNSLDRLHERLLELIRLTKTVNASWIHLCGWLILNNAVWFSKDFDVMRKVKDLLVQFYLVLMIFNLCTGLILSAECSRKVWEIINKNILKRFHYPEKLVLDALV